MSVGVPVVLTAGQRALVAGVAPRTPGQLYQWLRLVLDIEPARSAIAEGHDAPFDYLRHAFFDDGGEGARDCVVWACRGGGKTFYAAVATALDLIFKPGVEVRVLGGSMEQSRRMHEHLRRLFERPALRSFVEGRPTERRLALTNGSFVEILAQSHTSVRGARPQILRCDEVELFDPEIWEAAQLTTRSRLCGGVPVRGAVEALSTHHDPGGLMATLIGDETRRRFRWSVVDVLERCPEERPCAGCPIEPECAGRAKRARGHFTIDDAITLKSRTDEHTWRTEMLCHTPRRSDAVYAEFDPAAHVGAFDPPLEGGRWIGGMDFGLRHPAAILIAHLDGEGVLRVIDERITSGALLEEHVRAIGAWGWPTPEWIGVDPAGHQRSDQTGLSAIGVLRRSGIRVRARRSPVELGVRLVRARLRPATGSPTLYIHERCAGLIRAMREYRYGPGGVPRKDGPDHAADALRYMVLSLDRPFTAQMTRYA